MKKILLLTTVILILSLAFPALADTSSKMIPPYHWTYHSLETLSKKELIMEKIMPGQSEFTPKQVAAMILFAMDRIKSDPSKIGKDELLSMRQLINGYRIELESEGYDSKKLKTNIENYAMRAGLTAMETSLDLSSKPLALNSKAAHSVNEFTIDLYKSLAKQGRKNIFISPFSISSALSMTYAGARGHTEIEMGNVLYLTPEIHRSMAALVSDIKSVPPDTAKFISANAIWPAKQEKMLSNYVDTVQKYYGAALKPIDYHSDPDKARKTINSWTEKQTEGRIKDLIAPGVLQKETPLVLTNAVYFKSDWLQKFEDHDSIVMPFWVEHEKSVPTVMMNQTENGINYVKAGRAEIAELPYKDSRFSMLIILPDKEAGIEEIEKNLTLSTLADWTSAMSPKKTRLTIPKFKMEQSFELNHILAKMGMPTAFDDRSADFSGMNGRLNMYIGSVIHKTFLEVGEEGTEAAAATAIIMMKTSAPVRQENIIEFKADRPFIFMIKENESGTILFIGRYSKP